MSIEKKVSEYYTEKIKKHGTTSWGVDWNSKESQFLRFEQLCKVITSKRDEKFSILDYGCGYGALIQFLKENYSNFSYLGYDISEEMIKTASENFSKEENVRFTTDKNELLHSDYTIASGVFNVKLDTKTEEWENYIISTLYEMNNFSKKGFAFNMLTSYSDKEYMKDYLYYANPCWYFDFCKRNFSKNVSLLHDYNLYEFTLIVRK